MKLIHPYNIQVASSNLESETLFSREMISVSMEGFPCGQTLLVLVHAWLHSATCERSQHL